MHSVPQLIPQIVIGFITILLGFYLRHKAGEGESTKALRLFARIALVLGGLMVIFALLLIVPQLD